MLLGQNIRFFQTYRCIMQLNRLYIVSYSFMAVKVNKLKNSIFYYFVVKSHVEICEKVCYYKENCYGDF